MADILPEGRTRPLKSIGAISVCREHLMIYKELPQDSLVVGKALHRQYTTPARSGLPRLPGRGREHSGRPRRSLLAHAQVKRAAVRQLPESPLKEESQEAPSSLAKESQAAPSCCAAASPLAEESQAEPSPLAEESQAEPSPLAEESQAELSPLDEESQVGPSCCVGPSQAE